jgi:hypothetical protein
LALAVSQTETAKCKLELAKAYANPFTAYKPCLGTFPNPPSMKVTTLTRGTFSTGSLGNGYVMAGYGTAMDVNTIFATEFANGFSTVDPPSTTLAANSVVAYQATNAPITAGSLYSADGLHWRAICLGIRVRYIGTLLNRRGLLYGASVKDDSAALAGNTVFSVQNIPEDMWASVQPVGGGWFQYNYIDRHSQASHYTSSAGQGPVCVIWAHVDPNVTEKAVFEFEVVTHYEVIGKACQPMSTQSPNMNAGWISSLFQAGADLLGKAGNPENLLRIADVAYKASSAYNVYSNRGRRGLIMDVD